MTRKPNAVKGNGNGFARPLGLAKPIGAAGFAASALSTEGLRVASQVRNAHLAIAKRTDPDTKELEKRTKHLESFVDGKLKEYATSHPTFFWWSRITGCYLEIMGKILGIIEEFGKWYPAGDVMIPPGIKYPQPVDDGSGNLWVFVRGIERLTKPSALRKFAGLTPESKREAGELLEFNLELRTILFRLGQFGFMFRKNRYYEQYLLYKGWKLAELGRLGVKVMPTPKGRYCAKCVQEKTVPKTTFFCPDCNTKLSPKKEQEGVLFEGHLDMMCRRWMVQRFLDHLWAIWREAEGLPVTNPYVQGILGHVDIIDPWQMCDKDVGSLERVSDADVTTEESKTVTV
ncbi:MAG: hypothetical protein HYT61_01960 [Candidatus Yanofskybacteria bacterium]|nr:hypothetical protein [Candidatus Yanofskybacteria bacterium]